MYERIRVYYVARLESGGGSYSLHDCLVSEGWLDNWRRAIRTGGAPTGYVVDIVAVDRRKHRLFSKLDRLLREAGASWKGGDELANQRPFP